MVSELALTLVLLCGAGLLWRSFVGLYTADTVLDPRDVVTMQLTLPVQKYSTVAERRAFFRRLEERLHDVPTIASATLSSQSPVQSGAQRQVTLDGDLLAPDQKPPLATTLYVDSAYFETLRLPLLTGRALAPADDRAGQEAAVIDQRFADMLFPQGQAIGRRIQLTSTTPPSTSPWLTIVGVVATMPRYFGPGVQQLPDPAAYVPFFLDPSLRAASITVRAGPGGVAAAAPTLREEVRTLDPDLPLFSVARLEDAIALSRYPVRLVGTWFAVLAIIALVVAAVGLFAITAHGIAQRTPEIGLRIALGARGAQVVWMFLRRTLLQLVFGLALGLAGAVSIGSLLQTYLRQTSTRDPLTIAIVITLLSVVAAVATLLPARRAARVDPAVALRAD
jgi:putative ABC transport system permease protein